MRITLPKQALIQVTSFSIALCCALPPAHAADEMIKLEEVNVTAMREAKRHSETAASTFTLDQEALKATGGDSAYEAVRFADGVISDSMGPAGQSWGAMTSKTVMRGSRRGTLVLIDGMPANVNGYYNMEDIPLQTVKRIEGVRGASSTLYGSDAIGGVINVITERVPENAVSASLGDYDYGNYSLSLREDWTFQGQPGSIGVVGIYQNLGEVLEMSSSGYAFGGGTKRTGRIDVVQGAWSVSWQHTENEYSFDRYRTVGGVPHWSRDALIQVSDYEDTKDFVRARGSGERWQASVYANFQQRDYTTTRDPLTARVRTADVNYDASVAGGDLQYDWKPAWAEFMFGLSYQREHFSSNNKLADARVKDERDNLAVFVRGTKTFLDTWTASLGLRESYVSSGDITAFTPQFQLLKKFSHQLSAYVNVCHSFSMPTLRQLYDDTGIRSGANADLEPEEGWNYETGVKWEGERTLASLAVFTMDFDHITYVENVAEDRFYPQTLPFRNTGVELSVTHKLLSTLDLQAGMSYGKPEERSATTGIWSPVYGRVQANGRIRWTWDRYFASFNISYLGDRVYSRDMVPTTLKAGFSLGRFGRISGTVDNVFDRRDVTNHTSATTQYYATPRSYRITFDRTF